MARGAAPGWAPEIPGNEPGPDDGGLTATEAVWNDPHGRSANNKEKPMQILA